MQWSPLARRECRTVLTSKGAWILTALIVLWGFRPTYTGWNAIGQNITIGYIQLGVNLLLPIGALLLTYQSLIGERTTGSIKFLIALPLKRTQILLGKSVGRFAGIGAIVGVAVLLISIIGVVEHGTFAVLPFVGVVLATALLLAALVSLGVLLSTAVDSTVSAAASVLGYIFVTLFWSTVVSKVYTAITGVPVDPYDAPASGPLFFALRLTPDGAYNVLTNWLLGVGNSAEQFHTVYTKLAPGQFINAFVVEAAFESGTAPWYLHPALSIVILLTWIAVPMALSRRVFNNGDVL
ncbi:nitrite/nitrate reduction protein [Haloferax mucosum ATCC BAA-1512]|uniref:Nitrite/nitrate reduction protein n=1 Tax=Haloferax mucosum ATCC BAA-1512 TaxID=662479 RepID=M0IKH0_9EURY|nr:ABC transporter permease subunit [Haloferax mucosum]ELZ95954.1 nitrite/nitrate reduction protein [Haloferax mucosum ATCC BAA-1512]